MKNVVAQISFVVDDDVTNDQLDYILGTLEAQVEGEACVGYDDSLNEVLVPIHEYAGHIAEVVAADPQHEALDRHEAPGHSDDENSPAPWDEITTE